MNQFIQFLTNCTSTFLVVLSFDRFYSCCNCFTVDWATGFWDFHVCMESTKTLFAQQKQANLGHFSIFLIQNWTIVCLNQPNNWLVPLYCTYLSSDSLQKERLCLKIVLGQTRFEVYSASYYLPCDHSIVVRIGSATGVQFSLKRLVRFLPRVVLFKKISRQLLFFHMHTTMVRSFLEATANRFD